MAKLRVVKRIVSAFQAPEVTAHVLECLKIRFLGKFEFLLQINSLLAGLDLQKLCLTNFDHHFVAVRPLV